MSFTTGHENILQGFVEITVKPELEIRSDISALILDQFVLPNRYSGLSSNEMKTSYVALQLLLLKKLDDIL